MRMFKRRYYRSNSIRKAIAQFTANLIFLPPQTPVAFLTAMNANRSHPEIQIPPCPPLRKGGRGDFHGTLREASMLSFPVTTQASPWSMRTCAPQAPNFFCQLAFLWIRITGAPCPGHRRTLSVKRECFRASANLCRAIIRGWNHAIAGKPCEVLCAPRPLMLGFVRGGVDDIAGD
jgi:hypothetical protein